MAGLMKKGQIYHAVWREGGKEHRKSLRTKSRQVAKELLRQLESSLVRGTPNPLPTRTPLAEVIEAYVTHIKATKTRKSGQTDIYYLRQCFGPITPALEPTRKPPKRASGRPGTPKTVIPVIRANCFEDVTTAEISAFIATVVQAKGLAPKTANRYREILTRLFNWASRESGIRLFGGENPAAAVGRYKERAPNIRFLTLKQIREQLDALEVSVRKRQAKLDTFLAENGIRTRNQQRLDQLRISVAMARQIRVMVALYIYAGLRREEALWLQHSDIDLATGPYGLIRIRPKEIAGVYWESKTRRNRAVPISSALRAYLDDYRPRLSKGQYYFPSPQGERYDPDNFSRDLRMLQKTHGLKWNCLDFRHTFGSQLAMKGESLYKISALMGNSPDICRKHYAAIMPESMVDSVEFPGELPHKTGNLGDAIRLA